MKSFEGKIYIGFKETHTGIIHTLQEAEAICQKYCDETGFCVTLTPTDFIYTKGKEPGCIVGTIQYPRFPTDEDILKERTLTIAREFSEQFNQFRITVNFPDEVVMIDNDKVIMTREMK